jgi:hypothetical protein
LRQVGAGVACSGPSRQGGRQGRPKGPARAAASQRPRRQQPPAHLLAGTRCWGCRLQRSRPTAPRWYRRWMHSPPR